MNLSEFLRQISSGTCPPGTCLSIYKHEDDFSDTSEAIDTIATALSSGKCPPEFNLHLSHMHDLQASDILKLAEALNSGNCPIGFTLVLAFCQLTDLEASHLATALKKGKCPKGLTLNLNYNEFTDMAVSEFAAALSSGNCPEGLSLHLLGAPKSEQSAKVMALALSSGACPKNLSLEMLANEGFSPAALINQAMTIELLQALQSGRCPEGLSLNLTGNNNPYTRQEPPYPCVADRALLVAYQVAEALTSGKAPNNLSLNLSCQDFRVKSIQIIAGALFSGTCPPGLSLNLSRNPLKDKTIVPLASALGSGQCPENLSLNLEHTFLNDLDLQLIISALRTGKCPSGFSLNLSSNDFTDLGIKALLDTKTLERCPPGTTLKLHGLDLTDTGITMIEEALAHSSIRITYNEKKKPIEPKALDVLIKSAEKLQDPELWNKLLKEIDHVLIDLEDEYGRTPLSVAFFWENTTAIDALLSLEYGIITNEVLISAAIGTRCKERWARLIAEASKLFRPGAISHYSDSAFSEAIVYQNDVALDALLSMELKWVNIHALKIAAEKLFCPMRWARLLSLAAPDAFHYPNTHLWNEILPWAIVHQNIVAIDTLLAHPNVRVDYDALCAAAKILTNRATWTQLLRDAPRVDLNADGGCHHSALDMAILFNNFVGVEQLLRRRDVIVKPHMLEHARENATILKMLKTEAPDSPSGTNSSAQCFFKPLVLDAVNEEISDEEMAKSVFAMGSRVK